MTAARKLEPSALDPVLAALVTPGGKTSRSKGGIPGEPLGLVRSWDAQASRQDIPYEAPDLLEIEGRDRGLAPAMEPLRLAVVRTRVVLQMGPMDAAKGRQTEDRRSCHAPLCPGVPVEAHTTIGKHVHRDTGQSSGATV